MPGKAEQEKLIEDGMKYRALKEKEAKRTRAHGSATKRLIAAHQPEFETYLDEEKRKEGL
jgi:hypothetical protein